MRARLHQFLEAQQGRASVGDLLDLVFDGHGRDTEFGREFLRVLLSDDPRFREDDASWVLVEEHVLDSELGHAPFVVVDLETTGQRADDGGVTEIGAIRLEGLREVGRFQTLVHPGRSIPSFVAKLTGISDSMVAGAPRLEEVIADFVRFAEGGVLVAHNAAFDARLLDQATRRCLGRPLAMPTLCTVKLAQRLLPDQRRTSLEALSEHFGFANGNRHRAMADAERTVDLLGRFVPMLQDRGARTVQHLLEAQDNPAAPRRLEIHVRQSDLEDLPASPGVYRFIGRDEEPLLVGRAENLRGQVLRFFLDADHLSERQLGIVAKTWEVSFTRCGSALEAALVEAADVHRLEPVYNRGDRHLPKTCFVKVTARAPYARVFVTSRVATDGALYVGPLRGRDFADDSAELLAAAFRLRTCPGPIRPEPDFEPCALGPSGRCTSPCNAAVSAAAYASQVERLEACLRSRSGPRELIAAAGVTSASSDYGRLQGAARRLERLSQRAHWLVNEQHYLAVAPGAPGGLFVAAVVAGRSAGFWTVFDDGGVEEVLGGVRKGWTARPPSRDDRPVGDASTILAAWFQEAESSREGTLVALREGDEESLAEARGFLVAALAEGRHGYEAASRPPGETGPGVPAP